MATTNSLIPIVYTNFVSTLTDSLGKLSNFSGNEKIKAIFEVLTFMKINLFHFENPVMLPRIPLFIQRIRNLQMEIKILEIDNSLLTDLNQILKELDEKFSSIIHSPSKVPLTSSLFTPQSNIQYILNDMISPPKAVSINSFGFAIVKYLKDLNPSNYFDFLYFTLINSEYLLYPSMNHLARQVYIKLLNIKEKQTEKIHKELLEELLQFYEIHPELKHAELIPFEFSDNDYEEDPKTQELIEKRANIVRKAAEITIQKTRKLADLTILSQRMAPKIEWWLKKMDLIGREMYIDCTGSTDDQLLIEFGVYNREDDRIYKNKHSLVLQRDFSDPIKGAPEPLVKFLQKEIEEFFKITDEYQRLN